MTTTKTMEAHFTIQGVRFSSLLLITGTGAWTLSGNGTISNGAHFGGAILIIPLSGETGSDQHVILQVVHLTNTTLAPFQSF